MTDPAPTNQQAADVRKGIYENAGASVDALLALDALVARITDLEAQERALRQDLYCAKEYEAQWHELNTPEFTEYWFTIGKTCSAGEAIKDLLAAKEAAEAQVAALTQDNAVLRELPSREVVARAEAAEAEVARLEQEREGYALLAEDEAVRGEYHAEGLDERGIYGGKSHEPIDRRHPDYADDPWMAGHARRQPARGDGMSAQRWERIAAERGTRMDELQARAEAAEAALADANGVAEEMLAQAARSNEAADVAEAALAQARQALKLIPEKWQRVVLADTGGDTKHRPSCATRSWFGEGTAECDCGAGGDTAPNQTPGSWAKRISETWADGDTKEKADE